jgi:beta-galactosidase
MKQILFSISVFLLFSVNLISARDSYSFNDGWSFKRGAFSEDIVLNEIDSKERWQKIKIPHTWNAYDMQHYQNVFYEGEALYKKEYYGDPSIKDKRVFLRFEGVASVADVYVNRNFAGKHEGGYSAFAIEISDLLKTDKKNEIIVKVSNKSRPDVIPINHTLFGVYGGIYRPVQLIITEKTNISVTDHASHGIYIKQNEISDKLAEIQLTVKVENIRHNSEELTLESNVYESDGKKIKSGKTSKIVVSPQGRQSYTQLIKIKNPRLWQGLEDPYLYKVVTRLIKHGEVIDEVTQPLGIRHFELRAEDGMYLNGKKVPMYGVCRHQDWWKLGSALENKHHDTDLEIIKELGATTIRLAHYQQSEYFYSKCDSIGFLVWAEIPFVNRVSTHESGNAKQQLVELIRQNFNHPSIFIWGLHNEVYEPTTYTSALTSELHDLAKTEDPDRYTVSVNGYGDPGHPVNMNADVLGINRYFGWYEKKIQDMQNWIEDVQNKYPGYKMMLAEYGAEANVDQQQEEVGDVGDCCGPTKNYNETFATKFHELQWGYIKNSPYLLASYVWNTFDFATPVSYQGGVPARNMKGLVTFDRKIKKDPFYWYKANWSKEPVLYITQRRVQERQNKKTQVTVYSNLGKPTLIVNDNILEDFKQGTTPVHYIFEDVALLEGENSIIAKVESQGVLYEDSVKWVYNPDFRREQLYIIENSKEHIGL